MKYVTIAARLLLGLVFTVFGANYFLHFMPMEPEGLPADALAYSALLVSSGYMAVVKVLEVAGGLLLLVGRFVPLGVVILTPIILNILCFEIFFLKAPGLAGVLLILDVVLIVSYRKYFAPFFRPGNGTGEVK